MRWYSYHSKLHAHNGVKFLCGLDIPPMTGMRWHEAPQRKGPYICGGCFNLYQQIERKKAEQAMPHNRPRLVDEIPPISGAFGQLKQWLNQEKPR